MYFEFSTKLGKTDTLVSVVKHYISDSNRQEMYKNSSPKQVEGGGGQEI